MFLVFLSFLYVHWHLPLHDKICSRMFKHLIVCPKFLLGVLEFLEGIEFRTIFYIFHVFPVSQCPLRLVNSLASVACRQTVGSRAVPLPVSPCERDIFPLVARIRRV